MTWGNLAQFALQLGVPTTLGAAIIYWLLKVFLPQQQRQHAKEMELEREGHDKRMESQQELFKESLKDLGAQHRKGMERLAVDIKEDGKANRVLQRDTNTQLARLSESVNKLYGQAVLPKPEFNQEASDR